MTDQEFDSWAAEHGASSEIIELLTLCAATPEEMEDAYEAIEPPPPIYALEDIKEMSESSDYGFCPLEHRFLVIGGCPNGDPIAVDIGDDMGSAWYIDHESMYNSPPRSIAVRVADDVEQLLNGIAYEDGFPIDYFAAKKWQK